jgi:hypothetical protein
MPIHDWSRVSAGLFHHFHVQWISSISTALNAGALPQGYYALAEQHTGRAVPDVLTLRGPKHLQDEAAGGLAVATVPPRVWVTLETDEEVYVLKANRIVVHHEQGEVVAIIEIVSRGNKRSRFALNQFVRKAVRYLQRGVHLLIVDLFPPSKRDPQGIHPTIWDEIHDDPFALPAGKSLTLVSYVGGVVKRAYVEPLAPGDELPAMPLFLTPERYVPCPLAETYGTTWNVCPRQFQQAVLAASPHPR